MADLTGKRVGFYCMYSWYYDIIIPDLQQRGATVLNLYYPLSPGVLDTLDAIVVDEQIGYAPSSDLTVIRDWLSRGKAMYVQTDWDWVIPRVETLLQGTGIVEEWGSGYCYSEYLTDVLPHPTTLGVDTIYSDYYCAYLTATGPAQTIINDRQGRPHTVVSWFGPGKVIVAANQDLNSYNLYYGDSRLFANQVFDWLLEANFLTLTPTSGRIASNASEDITARFNARELIGGDYYNAIPIHNNDPDDTVKSVPVHLHVQGIPDIAIPCCDSISFDSVFVGFAKTIQLTIKNEGSESLLVTGISSSRPEFHALPATLTVPRFGERLVDLSFSPSDTGAVSALLSIASSDPDEPLLTLTLLGKGFYPSALTLAPESLNVTLPEGDSTSRFVTIGNAGRGTLDWSIPGFGAKSTRLFALRGLTIEVPPDLHNTGARSLGKVNAASGQGKADSMSAVLSDLYGRSIAFMSWSSYSIIYLDLVTRGATVGNLWFPIDSLALEGYNVLALDDAIADATDRDLNVIRVWMLRGGSLLMQADNSYSLPRVNALLSGTGIAENSHSCRNGTMTDIVPHPITFGIETIYADWYCGYCDVTPPAQTIVFDSLDNPHVAVSTCGRGRVVAAGDQVTSDYNLYSYHPGQTRLFANQIFDWLCGSNYLTVSPSAGTVLPGESQQLEVAFNAHNLWGGFYNTSLRIFSNDPGNNPKLLPTRLVVQGGPDIALSTSALDFGSIYLGSAGLRDLYVFNLGHETLQVSSVGCDNIDFVANLSQFSVAPGGGQTLRVTFQPTILGPDFGNLAIRSNDPHDSLVYVTVQGEGINPPTPGDTCSASYSGGHLVYADSGKCDTIRVGCPIRTTQILPNDSIPIPIYLWTDTRLGAFSLGFSYNSSMVEITSWSAVGGVIPPAGQSQTQFKADTVNNRCLLGWLDVSAFSPILPTAQTSAQLLGTMYMRILPGATPDTIDLDSVFVPPAGRFILSPVHGIKLRPEYVDCGTTDIVLDSAGVLCGDADGSQSVDISDGVYLIAYIFGGGPEPDPIAAGDADCSGAIDVSDVVYLLNYIFAGGPAPCADCM